MLTILAVFTWMVLVTVCLGLYRKVVPLQTLMLSLVGEVKTRDDNEAAARRELAKARAELLAAVGELRAEFKEERMAFRAAEVAARGAERRASRAAALERSPPPTEPPLDGDRVTLELSRPPPGCEAEADAPEPAAIAEGDPTRVLSREATAAAIRGVPGETRVGRTERAPAPPRSGARSEPESAGFRLEPAWAEPKPSRLAPPDAPLRNAMRPPAPFLVASTREPLAFPTSLIGSEDLFDDMAAVRDEHCLGPDELTPPHGMLASRVIASPHK